MCSQIYPVKHSYGLIFKCIYIYVAIFVIGWLTAIEMWIFHSSPKHSRWPIHPHFWVNMSRCCGNTFPCFTFKLFNLVLDFACALYVLIFSIFECFLGTVFHKKKNRNIPELTLLSNYMAETDLSYRKFILHSLCNESRGWPVCYELQ